MIEDTGEIEEVSGLLLPPARVAVLLPLPLAGAYDYAADPALGLGRGDVVEVPLGSRRLTGVVWGPGSDELAAARLKPVIRRHEVPRLPEPLLRLVDWVASYTLHPPGAVLRMALSVPAALEPPRPQLAWAAAPGTAGSAEAGEAPRLTAARGRVLAVLDGGPPMTASDLAREAAVGAGVVKAMGKAGLLAEVALPADPPLPVPDPDAPRATPLSAAQDAAAAALRDGMAAGGFQVTLLDGVTGAGKTEVYFEAVAEALRAGRQVLVLLPEIALGAAFLARFRSRFGAPPAEWHSDLTQRRRRRTWRAVAEGRARVVVGARSALFLPFPDLGLIVVDEEHEAAFKQEDGVPYHGRDMAVVRASLGGHPIVLSSATPTLETVVNAERGRYRKLALPSRHGSAGLPEVAAIDLRRTPPERGRWLSPPLVRAVEAALADGEQALLFLNRRGYAPLTLCRACGHRLECPHCSAWLVEHRLLGRLQCHHCGYTATRPETCRECGAVDSFVASGPGVERLAEEVYLRFPDARVQIASSDTLAGPAGAAELVRAVEDGEVDILVGTQVIAKGHHFPLLTVVGVVDADLGLAGGDLRAGERTYQLLHQVAGRAGRAERRGRVLLQTHDPGSAVMQALVSWDRDGFVAEEARARENAGQPPFGRLVAVVVSAPDAARADAAASLIARHAPRFDGVTVLGPAPAPLALLRGRHRRRLLLKAGRQVNVQKVVRDWLAPLKLPGGASLAVDVDPYSFM